MESVQIGVCIHIVYIIIYYTQYTHPLHDYKGGLSY